MTDETTVLPDPVPAPDPATPVAPDPPATPAAAPSTGQTPSTGKASRKRRTTATAGQVLGVVGIVVSIALIAGVLVGRGWLTEQVDTVSAALDTAITRTEPLLDTAQTTLDELAVRLDQAADAAEAIAADPSASQGALQGVIDGLSSLSERYLGLRNTYADAREQVVSVMDRLALLDRLVPGFSVPQGPVDALTAVDAQVQAIDAGIMQLVNATAAIGSINETAQRIADRIRGAEATLAGIDATLDDVATRVSTLKAELDSFAATIATVITLLAVLLVLVLLYVIFLHVVLFRASRGYGRASAGT